MADETGIEWADSTFNPWMGCTRVSPACDDCYAARSTPARSLGVAWGSGEPRRRTSDANWKLPLQWDRQHAEFFKTHGRRRRVFCASLADVFDNEVPVQWRADLLQLIDLTPNIDWLLLTKRIGNVKPMLKDIRRALGGALAFDLWPRPNVWLGITVVNQAEADRDVPKLLAVPARVRFLSIEPMLGRVYIEDISDPDGGVCLKPLAGLRWVRNGQGRSEVRSLGGRIDWVICGGESGPKARPMHPDWVRSLRDQCAAADVPFLFKQWGEWIGADQEDCPWGPPASRWQWGDGTPFTYGGLSGRLPLLCRAGKKAAGRHLDGVTHDGFPGGQGA